jgi:hypothetical protein
MSQRVWEVQVLKTRGGFTLHIRVMIRCVGKNGVHVWETIQTRRGNGCGQTREGARQYLHVLMSVLEGNGDIEYGTRSTKGLGRVD